jgi:PBP1b-binding outer membrane lipoprotein LpoB
MNNVKRILFIIVAVSLIYGCGSSDRRQEKQQQITKTQKEHSAKRNNLSFEQLSAKQLRAFENRADQKFKDYIDYINMIADTAIDIEFREQAQDMAIAVFKNRSKTNFSKTQRPILIQKYLKLLIKEGDTNKINLSESRLIDSLFKEKSNGKISAALSIGSSLHLCEIDFSVKKETKKFGDTKKKVWNIYLGDVMLIE